MKATLNNSARLANGISPCYYLGMAKRVKKVSMSDVFNNPRYRGKHVVLAAGKIYSAKTGEGAAKILRKVRQKFPKVTPEVAYLPKAHSLIL